MKTIKIIEIEKQNNDTIHLIKQGAFWRVYERSAFRFVKHIKNSRIIKKYFKTLDAELVYCSFPNNALQQIIDLAQKYQIEKSNNEIFIKDFYDTEQDFSTWKNNIKTQTKEIKQVNKYIEQLTESLKELNPHLILLFGSYAYGTPHKDSDIDILVVINDDSMPTSYSAKRDLYLKVVPYTRSVISKVPVDLLVFTMPMYEQFKTLKSNFSKELLNKGKFLYERHYKEMA